MSEETKKIAIARIGNLIIDLISAVDKIKILEVKEINRDTLALPSSQRRPGDVWGVRLGMTILDLKTLIAEGRYHGFIPKE